MLSAGGMTERVRVYRKGNTDTSPESWTSDGIGRRAEIHRVSDRAALEESAAQDYAMNVTHTAYVDYDADAFEPVGGGTRLLVALADGQNYWILRAVADGRRGRTGRTRYMRLSLCAFEPAAVTV